MQNHSVINIYRDEVGHYLNVVLEIACCKLSDDLVVYSVKVRTQCMS